MAAFTDYPGTKVYTDAEGHRREIEPTQSRAGDWYYNWSLNAYCTDECPLCGSEEQDDYAGERWDEDY